jgi:phosphopantothenoylcysteine decarboxylase
LKELGDVQAIFTDNGWDMARGGRLADQEWVTANFRGHCDADEWPNGWSKGDPVLHIDLKNWADILVIAPCTANTMAKIANGMADNLLTNVVRAWPEWKPLIIAPSMNTDMWDKMITREQLRIMSDCQWNSRVISPQVKTLACGDHGNGAMANIEDIVDGIKDHLRWVNPFLNMSANRPFIPENPHPGSFGQRRKYDVHTGVDLYTIDKSLVRAVEPGVVVDIVDFTGSKVIDTETDRPMSWWNDTKAILVKGASGIVVYGEVEPTSAYVGQVVRPGQSLAQVKAVLPPDKLRRDIPHHSTAMLHIELYTNEAAEKNFRWGTWKLDGERPDGLLDPTPFLKNMVA